MLLVNNSMIYGRPYGKWLYAYLCHSCNSYVGVHPNTKIPLGHLADLATRKARIRSKKPFFDMVKSHFSGNRGNAYKWLAKEMNIDSSECHFGMFDIEMCQKAQALIENKISGEL